MPPAPLPTPPRSPDPVALVWIAGVGLAVLAYAVGPAHLVSGVLDAVQRAGAAISEAIHHLSDAAFDAMRAAAIGLLGVFVALTLLVIRRQGHGRGGLIMVPAAFLLLVWGADGDSPVETTRWMLALLLAAVGAVTATNRLVRPGPGGWRLPSQPQ